VDSLWLWIIFCAGLLALLVVDLAAFGGRPREVSLYKAAAWSTLWIAISLAFALWLWLYAGTGPAVEFLSGYLIEKSLSIDNLFVFVLIFEYFRVPIASQHRVLAWGIFAALVLRGVLIALGAAFVHAFSWSFYIFGIFLIYASLHILFRKNKARNIEGNRAIHWIGKILPTAKNSANDRFFLRENGRRVATMLFLALLAVEAADVLFAIDSIPAVFGVTRDPFIVFSSNACAVLGLRALYFVLAGWILRLRHLATGVAIILLFIGCKMLAAHWIAIPPGLTLTVIASALAIATVASVFGRPEIRNGGPVVGMAKEFVKDNLDLKTLSTAELIVRLESPDGASRDTAARELFHRGRDNAERSIAAWRANPEIGALISNRATIGIAVTRERFARIRLRLGEPRLAEVPADQDAEEFEWSVDSSAHLDILTTRAQGEDGAIAKFLAKFGEGIQQVEFLTPDIGEVTRLLGSLLNVTAIYPATRNGADGTRVNFFLGGIPSGGKILIELVEAKR
jgi:tellurite resistance protein TerC